MSVSEKVKCIEGNDKKWWRRGGFPTYYSVTHHYLPLNPLI